MYQEDYYNPADQNDYDDDQNVEKMFEKAKRQDRGYNVIYRKAQKKDGRFYNKRIEIYTSSGVGNHIRDAETGEYYSNLVGSKDEDLFFKVILATGECKSANGSSTLFYNTPQHYANHLCCDVDPKLASNWELKRQSILSELSLTINKNFDSIEIK